MFTPRSAAGIVLAACLAWTAAGCQENERDADITDDQAGTIAVHKTLPPADTTRTGITGSPTGAGGVDLSAQETTGEDPLQPDRRVGTDTTD